MWRPLAWLWGLVPLAVLVAVALTVRGPAIQADLAGRAATALADAGQGWAKVAVAGRDAVLTGDAPTEERRRRALEAVAATYGVRRVEQAAVVLPAQSPFTIAAERRNGTVTLTGFAPDGEAQAWILERARQAFGPAAIDGNLRLASGLRDEPAWRRAIEYGFTQLARLGEGRMSLSDLALTLEGRAIDLDAFGAVGAALRDPPPGVSIARSALSPPLVQPYTWSATLAAGRVVLAGYVPTDEARGAVLQRAERLGAVEDTMRPADGAPASYPVLTAFALDQLARLTEGSATLTDTTLVLRGRARTPQAQAEIEAALARAPNGSRVNISGIEPASVAPFTWSAVFDGTAVTVGGHVPDVRVRATLMEQAARLFPGRPVSDRMLVALGAPGNFEQIASFALTQLPRLARGEARLSDAVLTLEGTAANPDAFAALFGPRNVPNGAVVTARITPSSVSPHLFTVAATPAAVALTGFVPSLAARAAITDAVRANFPNVPVDDQTKVAVGTPLPDWQAVALYAVERLSRLASGKATLQDVVLTLSGNAGSRAARTAVLAELATLPQGVAAGEHVITAPDPPPPAQVAPPPPKPDNACQRALDAAGLTGRITFATGRADILDDSEAKLRAVVAALTDCPDARVEVGGHTDNVGERPANLELSLRRAVAVVDWLANAGVARQRLNAAGYGPDHPVASNDSDEGRAQNRRIDFVIIP